MSSKTFIRIVEYGVPNTNGLLESGGGRFGKAAGFAPRGQVTAVMALHF